MVRYYGLYANALRGKVKKVGLSPTASCTHGFHEYGPHGSHEDCKAAEESGEYF